jgi:hypothetical protein
MKTSMIAMVALLGAPLPAYAIPVTVRDKEFQDCADVAAAQFNQYGDYATLKDSHVYGDALETCRAAWRMSTATQICRLKPNPVEHTFPDPRRSARRRFLWPANVPQPHFIASWMACRRRSQTCGAP